MGEYHIQKKVKLFCGILYSDINIFSKAKEILENEFSEIDFISEPIPFSYSSYYQDEMGNNIYRLYLSFKKLIYPYRLSDIKKITNSIEDKLKIENRRKVNIDPGYISMSNLVLATTKNYSHRIALSAEIYGEVTLIYKNNRFIPLEWTYPDYKDPQNIIVFDKIRKTLTQQLKQNVD